MTDENRDDFIDVVIPEKGLHRPARVELGGKIYQSAIMSDAVIEKISALEDKVRAGDLQALKEQIQIVFRIPKKAMDGKDMRDLGVIAGVATKMMMESELYRTDTEKKTDEPGETNSV